MNNTIIICEPQCYGFEHSIFNAALLSTILIAYPNAEIDFWGERNHLNWVQKQLAQVCNIAEHHITWHEIDIPSRNLSDAKRVPLEFLWCSQIIKYASKQKIDLLVICSITSAGLLALKLTMYKYKVCIPIVVILHSILSFIVKKSSLLRFWHRLLSIRLLLQSPTPRNLRYLVLSDSILASVVKELPRISKYFTSIDHPYFWQKFTYDVGQVNKMTFGYFGANDQGFKAFYQLASDTKRIIPEINYDFLMVGFQRTQSESQEFSQQVVKGLSTSPLTKEEYLQRASSITYAVWTRDPETYRFTASATFLDALAYIKPGIYLRNPYIESYFDKMGDIGYLCNTYEEIREVTLSILKEFPKERYCNQCENIIRGRKIFEPRLIAPKLRTIVNAYL